eukprot:977211-Pelagomonas_calceolata.AAC.2
MDSGIGESVEWIVASVDQRISPRNGQAHSYDEPGCVIGRWEVGCGFQKEPPPFRYTTED